jgi:hypothetical protein
MSAAAKVWMGLVIIGTTNLLWDMASKNGEDLAEDGECKSGAKNRKLTRTLGLPAFSLAAIFSTTTAAKL